MSSPRMAMRVIVGILVALASGCEPYLVIKVEDPLHLAGAAVTLAIEGEDGEQRRVTLDELAMPVSVTVTSWSSEPKEIWVEALSAQGAILGRGHLSAALSSRNLPVVVTLAPPCEGPDHEPAAGPDSRCDDSVYCNGLERCVSRTCQAGPPPCPGSPFACVDVACVEQQGVCGVRIHHDRCGAGICDPGAGCREGAVCESALACDDGVRCNGVEGCASGRCTPGAPPQDDDDNPCTDGVCTEGGGILQVPLSRTPCTSDEGSAGICQRGVCNGPLSQSTCNEDAACADGLACNGAELCIGGRCYANHPPVQDDGNPCTADDCVEPGGVTHTPLPDGSSCPLPVVDSGVGACQAGLCTDPGDAPESPANLTATATSATSVAVSWSAVTGARHYEVQYREHGAASFTSAPLVATTSAAIAGLAADTLHEVRVRALSPAGTSAFSAPVSVALGCVVALRDPFDAFDAERWDFFGSPLPAYSGGRMRLQGGIGPNRHLQSKARFDLSVFPFEAHVTVGNTAGENAHYLEVNDGGTYVISVQVNEGTTLLLHHRSERTDAYEQVAAIPYDAWAHARLALMVDGDEVVFAAGPVGGPLSELARTFKPSWIGDVGLGMGLVGDDLTNVVLELEELSVQSAACAPATPTGLTSSGDAEDELTVTFSPVSRATHYEVQHRVHGGGAFTLGDPVTSPPALLTNLSPHVLYEVQVRALNDAGASAFSAPHLALTGCGVVDDFDDSIVPVESYAGPGASLAEENGQLAITTSSTEPFAYAGVYSLRDLDLRQAVVTWTLAAPLASLSTEAFMNVQIDTDNSTGLFLGNGDAWVRIRRDGVESQTLVTHAATEGDYRLRIDALAGVTIFEFAPVDGTFGELARVTGTFPDFSDVIVEAGAVNTTLASETVRWDRIVVDPLVCGP